MSQSATICIVAYGKFLGGVTPSKMCDTQLHGFFITNHLHPFNQSQSGYEFVLSMCLFTSTLKTAVNLFHVHRETRKLHPVKDRVWNGQISVAVKQYKLAWWQGRMAGHSPNR